LTSGTAIGTVKIIILFCMFWALARASSRYLSSFLQPLVIDSLWIRGPHGLLFSGWRNDRMPAIRGARVVMRIA
jgi:hypothetical protein